MPKGDVAKSERGKVKRVAKRALGGRACRTFVQLTRLRPADQRRSEMEETT